MREPDVRYFTGLDLGQQNEFTALAVLEKTEAPDPDSPKRSIGHYAVRHLERFSLGTPYGEVFARMAGLFAEPPLKGSHLVVDITGVGRPVIDLLLRTKDRPSFTQLAIGAGLKANRDQGVWLVPKRDLVGVLQVLLQNRRIRVAETLPDAATLVKELQSFQVKPAAAGADDLLSWREGAHDDLVLAVAIAAWHGERCRNRAIRKVPFFFEAEPAPLRWGFRQ